MGFLKSLVRVLFLTFGCQTAFSQSMVADVQQQFDAYQRTTLQEKLYVHTDKASYVAGEIIWFKLYNVDAGAHTPLSLSKIAYVDVLDAGNKPVVQVKVSLKEGRGSGSAVVPLGTGTGQYSLRAYTNWMKNFDAAPFFEKPITIINTLKNEVPAAADTSDAYAVTFFPEGGNLVNGLESKVAVKVIGRNGRGSHFTSIVFNEEGDSTASMQASKFGIGNFFITPASGHVYTAILTLASGRKINKTLPQAYEEGYVMQLRTSAAGRIEVEVKANGLHQHKDVYLFAGNGQTLRIAEAKRLQNGRAVFSFDTGKLWTGITYFTVFNEERKPVCERLYFKKPMLENVISASSDQVQYDVRKKVEVDIHTINASDSMERFDLSVSVYKWDTLQAVARANIQSYLWLQSALSGTVEEADYYFSTDATSEATDNLMLTHGWRRFRWQAVLADKKQIFTFPLEYNGHLLQARVTDAKTNKPAPGVPTFLSIPGVPFQFYVSQSDSTGLAHFDLKNRYGPGELIFQTNSSYGNQYLVEVISPFAQPAAPALSNRFFHQPENNNALLEQSIGMQVQQIYSKERMASFRLPQVLDTVPFYGHAAYRYPLDVYTRFQTMEEVLREYVRPVNVVQRNGGLHMMILNEVTRQPFDGGELVLLDGIPVFDKNKIFSYDPLKVKKLEVVNRKYLLGPAIFNGIASFTTYTGNYEGYSLDPGTLIIDYEGLQLEREFYEPVYDTPQQYASRVPDFRNTLFWKPDLVLKANGQGGVRFYTSDQKGTYQVVVEGISKAGHAVSTGFRFTVK